MWTALLNKRRHKFKLQNVLAHADVHKRKQNNSTGYCLTSTPPPPPFPKRIKENKHLVVSLSPSEVTGRTQAGTGRHRQAARGRGPVSVRSMTHRPGAHPGHIGHTPVRSQTANCHSQPGTLFSSHTLTYLHYLHTPAALTSRCTASLEDF
ncbi:hypothetical protein ElyMa_004938900 [Elysia marginata]|uniref:Uncharacterized protein n=1 Tax=Elysia marginata TaxID=1093978 RepID=A0AAV4J063_9GAST|nr:hypothetical protein ElyMa_004938900 [Elysia marginata]